MSNLKVRQAAHARGRNAQRERKKLRARRREIHLALTEARRLKKSKKRGCSDIDKNMEAMGFRRIAADGLGRPIEEVWAPVG